MLTMNYTYRIYPDAVQQAELRSWLETCRSVYNYALRELKDWIASRKCPIDRCSLEKEYIIPADEPFPSYHRQQNNLPKAKKQFPHLAKVQPVKGSRGTIAALSKPTSEGGWIDQ